MPRVEKNATVISVVRMRLLAYFRRPIRYTRLRQSCGSSHSFISGEAINAFIPLRFYALGESPIQIGKLFFSNFFVFMAMGPKPKYTTGGVKPAIKNNNPRIIFSLTTNSLYSNVGCN